MYRLHCHHCREVSCWIGYSAQTLNHAVKHLCSGISVRLSVDKKKLRNTFVCCEVSRPVDCAFNWPLSGRWRLHIIYQVVGSYSYNIYSQHTRVRRWQVMLAAERTVGHQSEQAVPYIPPKQCVVRTSLPRQWVSQSWPHSFVSTFGQINMHTWYVGVLPPCTRIKVFNSIIELKYKGIYSRLLATASASLPRNGSNSLSAYHHKTMSRWVSQYPLIMVVWVQQYRGISANISPASIGRHDTDGHRVYQGRSEDSTFSTMLRKEQHCSRLWHVCLLVCGPRICFKESTFPSSVVLQLFLQRNCWMTTPWMLSLRYKSCLNPYSIQYYPECIRHTTMCIISLKAEHVSKHSERRVHSTVHPEPHGSPSTP